VIAISQIIRIAKAGMRGDRRHGPYCALYAPPSSRRLATGLDLSAMIDPTAGSVPRLRSARHWRVAVGEVLANSLFTSRAGAAHCSLGNSGLNPPVRQP